MYVVQMERTWKYSNHIKYSQSPKIDLRCKKSDSNTMFTMQVFIFIFVKLIA